MKIILATPIYPPKIGGPAQYVKNLGEKLKKKRVGTEVVSYNNLGKYPQPFRFLLYFFELLRKSKNSEIIYAFNLISCGLPSWLCSKILNKKMIMRLGGDFLWERAAESGRTKKPLKNYYLQPKNLGEKFWTLIIKKIFKKTNKIIFTSNFQKEIYKKYFGIEEEKTVIIPNPFPETRLFNHNNPKPETYNLISAGRLLKLKNLDTLIEVFADIQDKTSNINPILRIIGEGPEEKSLKFKVRSLKLEDRVVFEKPIPHRELLREIQKSYLFVLPSLTEISPNLALECIKLKKPILLTKETEYYQRFKENLIFINPKDKEEIKDKIIYLLDEKNYKNYIEKIKKINVSWGWEDIIEEHLNIFKNLCFFG